MAKMGITSKLSDLDTVTADCFLIAAAEFARIETEKMKRGKNKR